MLSTEELLLIVYFILASLLLISFVIIFFVAFQKRKKKLIFERYEAERKYEKEFATSRLEIQEEILKTVGRELHDNIGQLLSVTNMQLSILEETAEKPLKQNLGNIREVVRNTIQEVRALSKSLNSEAINAFGLKKSIEGEVHRLNRMTNINFVFQSVGEDQMLNPKDSVIIFRILQEFINNSLKHSEAKNLYVNFDFTQENLFIKMEDDGVGFDPKKVSDSSGMINMSSRAKLINATCHLTSELGKGTHLNLVYPKR